MVLPSPMALAAIGTALCVGAGLVFFFLKSPSLAFDLAIAGGVVLFAASIAYGYYAMGEDHIRPQLVACEKKIEEANARAQTFFDQAAAKVVQLEALTKEKNAAIAKLTTDFNARLAAQAEDIRRLAIPADAGLLINPAIAAVNAGARLVADAGSEAGAAAAVAGATTLGQVEQWAGDVIALYGKCVTQVAGLQDFANTLTANSPKPVH